MGRTLDEHFHYLSLGGRLDFYRQALTSKIKPGDHVVDLGCGIGVLGFEAIAAGAARVDGIDHSDAVEIARETARRLGLEDRYFCNRASTFRVSLPDPADLILCDHVGYFGIDYGIIALLEDARHRMLKPGGSVIPSAISLMIAGVCSDSCRRQIGRWQGEGIPQAYNWLHEYEVNSSTPCLLEADDLATGPALLGTISLTTDSPDSFAFNTELTVVRSGRLDALVGWFDCELAEGVRMTNSPLEEEAIGRHQLLMPLGEPVDVDEGDSFAVRITIRHESGDIAWSVTPSGAAARQHMANFKSKIIAPADLEASPGQPVSLNALGIARRALLEQIDGKCSVDEITAAILRKHPDLFPSTDEIRRFVAHELRYIAR